MFEVMYQGNALIKSETTDLFSRSYSRLENIVDRERREVSKKTESVISGVVEIPQGVFNSNKQKRNVVNQSSRISYDLVMHDIREQIAEIQKNTSSEFMGNLLSNLARAKDKTSFLGAHKKLIEASVLVEKRLENAVEVNFKAYLPEKAPILYKDWKKDNKGKSAIDCLLEVYGEYLELGVLYQDDLGGKEGLDPDLLQAIKNYCTRKILTIAEYLPPKTEKHSKLSLNLDAKKAQLINGLYRKNKK